MVDATEERARRVARKYGLTYVLFVRSDGRSFGPFELPSDADRFAREYFGEAFEHAETNDDFAIVPLEAPAADSV